MRTMKKTMWKTTFREIKLSFGRFMAIFAIVALGVGFFAGLKVTREAMVRTTGDYLSAAEFYDYRILSTLGFEEEDVKFFADREEVRRAEGSITYDILYEVDGNGGVLRGHMLTEGINSVKLLAGRLPEEPWECVVDANRFSKASLGKKIVLLPDNAEEDLEHFAYREYTITGVVQSPAYIQYERGNTSLGSGVVTGFFYLLPEGFSSDYYTELYVKFDEDFELYSDAYDSYLESKEPVFEALAAQAGKRRYDAIMADGRAEIADARAELAEKRADAEAELLDAENELLDAEKELSDGEKEIRKAKRKLTDGERELTEKEAELQNARQKVQDGENDLENGRAELNRGWEEWRSRKQEAEEGKQKLADAEAELAAQEAVLDEKQAEILAGEQELAANREAFDTQRAEAEAQLDAAEAELVQKKAEAELAYGAGLLPEEDYQTALAEAEKGEQALASLRRLSAEKFAEAEQPLLAAEAEFAAGKSAFVEGKQQLMAYKAELAVRQNALTEGEAALETARETLSAADKELAEGSDELDEAREQIADGEQQIEAAKKEIAKNKKKLADAEAELADGQKEYEDGRQEYSEAKADFEKEIADAEAEIADAEAELLDVKEPETYVLGRDTNVGYVCFENDSSIVDGIANVFPIFFFLVAALVCSTTMNRMVEEQRTQIGVLKALGYSKAAIMTKYLFYSGVAAVAGTVFGFALGTKLFPQVIWKAYGIMYRVDTLQYVFDWKLAVISLAAAMLCTMGTTWLSCRYALSQMAAELMRPKAPRPGKRIFLEYLPFLWKRLSFLHKVSMRNIFRYKKRLFMMIIGIGGCTALLVTGFGIRDSIAHVAEQQFEEIQTYDLGVVTSEAITPAEEAEFAKLCGISEAQLYPLLETTLDLVGPKGQKAVSLEVADADRDITPFLKLHTTEKEPIPYPGPGEAVITAKTAEALGIHVGDTVILQEEGKELFTLRVSGINRNFIYNYVYINADTYRMQMGREPEYKTVWLNLPAQADAHSISAALMQLDSVTNVTVNADVMKRFTEMMASLNMIVAVVILCAGGLAFIVLYNLTNINITERVREIATIKVLGFYKKETSAYVFRENVLLTVMGALLGLPLGFLLHRFVMSEINIDMIAFDTRIQPVSYFYSVVLTVAFAWLINRVMRIKLHSVSMTESLKSVD